ncbi:hypothetical protein BaRGS_00015481 [Batillaria attramentaria]|uniref:Uncharacterized protein n=1 Tax=Batillaria attramentaria TaxID=370345 RepID=A0ABD0L1L8_9CAEN
MVSGVQTGPGVTATATSTFSTVGILVHPSSLSTQPLQSVSSGCPVVPSVAVRPPDILATSPHPPVPPPHPEADRSHGQAVSVPVPHPYQGVAGYPRAPVPVTVADPLLATPMMQAMYPALIGHTHPSAAHPVMGVAGHGPGGTDIGVPPSYHLHTADASIGVSHLGMGGEALPDIVHSHNVGHALPPRPNQHRSAAGAAAARHHRQRHQTRTHGGRTRTSREGGSRSAQQRRRSRAHSTASSTQTDEGRCKEPCVKCMVTVTSFRWVLVVLSLLGVMCVVTGIVLAALHAAGNSFLFLAIMFIGLGVLLVIVVAVGWKCTPRGHEPLHALFSIGDFRNGRRERRTHRHRHRDGNWYGGMMYPEFQYRRPPPTYAASMQEYNSQLALAQANNNNSLANTSGEDYSLPGSPPPSYRSRASTIHSGVHITFPPGHDSAPNSRPPTYRSRIDSHQRPRLPMDDTNGDVAFTGPVMNADTVQQIIGTRSHQRQGSSNAGVWHTRSASADLAQGSDIVRHRRGASLDNSTISAGLAASSLGPHGPSPLTITQSGDVVTHSVDNGQNTVTVRVTHTPETVLHQDTDQTEAQTNSSQVTGSVHEQSEGGQQGEQAGVTSVTVNAASGNQEREEPEQYNTAL